MAQEILELLESLIAGHEMSPGELDDSLNQKHVENLYVEYKHAKELNEGKKAAATLRQYLSGFANSAGGILLIGVDELNWEITGCKAPGGGDLAKWASDCLTPIAAYFSPVPRFGVVKHQNGEVLVASTNRSLALVPCLEEGKIVYYFRFHDKTLEAPEYLVSDLVLGRRQIAYLQIQPTWFTLVRILEQGGATMYLDPSANIRVENQSLSWAEDVRLGLISWNDNQRARGESLNQYLLSYLELHEVDKQRFSRSPKIVHAVNRTDNVEPFRAWDTHLSGLVLPLRTHDQWHVPYAWKAAAYLMAKGTPPIWFQVIMNVNTELLSQFKDDRLDVPAETGLIKIQQLSGRRPVVAWDCI